VSSHVCSSAAARHQFNSGCLVLCLDAGTLASSAALGSSGIGESTCSSSWDSWFLLPLFFLFLFIFFAGCRGWCLTLSCPPLETPWQGRQKRTYPLLRDGARAIARGWNRPPLPPSAMVTMPVAADVCCFYCLRVLFFFVFMCNFFEVWNFELNWYENEEVLWTLVNFLLKLSFVSADGPRAGTTRRKWSWPMCGTTRKIGPCVVLWAKGLAHDTARYRTTGTARHDTVAIYRSSTWVVGLRQGRVCIDRDFGKKNYSIFVFALASGVV
jgi:hypothetical protein